MFIDHVTIRVKAGDGGRGCVAFRRERGVEYGGPSGGDGGNGGSVLLRADPHQRTLIDFKFKPEYEARRGDLGQGKNCSGRSGDDLVVLVPCGTLIKDHETGRLLADLVAAGDTFRAAQGGHGGRGNQHFATATRRAPDWAETGTLGTAALLDLELRVLADVGLIGAPNAGKSSLLARVSAAHPKVAAYPFTTLEPNLGVVSLGVGESFVVADLPGLIEGAHAGKGLGHEFLRHVARTRILVHVVDCGLERTARELNREHDTILAELESYDPALLTRPRLLVGNKLDLPGADGRFAALAKHAAKRGAGKALAISAATGAGLPALVRAMQVTLKRAPEPAPFVADAAPPAVLAPRARSRVRVVRDRDGMFLVRGREVERAAAAMSDRKDLRAQAELKAQLDRLGVDAALARAGIKAGDVVRIGDVVFEYVP